MSYVGNELRKLADAFEAGRARVDMDVKYDAEVHQTYEGPFYTGRVYSTWHIEARMTEYSPKPDKPLNVHVDCDPGDEG